MILIGAVVVVPVVIVAVGNWVRSRSGNLFLAPVIGAGIAIPWGLTLPVDEITGNVGLILCAVVVYGLLEMCRRERLDFAGVFEQKRKSRAKRAQVRRKLRYTAETAAVPLREVERV